MESDGKPISTKTNNTANANSATETNSEPNANSNSATKANYSETDSAKKTHNATDSQTKSNEFTKTKSGTKGGSSTKTNSATSTFISYSKITPILTPRSWVTYNSPLWRKDRVKSEMELSHSMPTTPRILSRMETGFVNDAIVTHVKSHRRNPIIRPYDAISDKYAQAYFKSPFVQSVMERNKALVNLKEVKNARTVNKLSVRRRCKNTPNVEKMRERETGFVNDAIITEKKRTKYKDIIPPYNASSDKLCKAYFTRPDVQRLTNVTCAPENRVKIKPNVATA